MTVWQPGMRCVCIQDEWTTVYGVDTGEYPCKGLVYTVSKVWPKTDWGVLLALAELDAETGNPAIYVRPLSETRLNQFLAYLNRVPSDLVPA